MKLGLSKWPLASLSGTLVILFYCLFTFTSWFLYPEPLGPLTHYLSRLGDFVYSPLGAYFYNAGCILTGAALIPFFIGLRQWYTRGRLQRGILIIGQVAGVCSAAALIMIGVFSEDKGSPHMLASSIFFELNFLVLILVNVALLLHPRFMKLIALYGAAVAISSLVFAFVVEGPLVEWYTVFASLAYVGFLSVDTCRLAKAPVDTELAAPSL